MIDDPIVAEVRKYRQEYAAKFGYDVRRIAADIMKRQRKSGHKLVSFVKEGIRQARPGRLRPMKLHGVKLKHRRLAKKDPIVEEIHRVRAEHSKQFNHDLDAMFKDLQRREALSRARGVKFAAPRKRKKTGAV